MFGERLSELRRRLRQGALSIGVAGIPLGLGHDLGFGAVLVAIGAIALALDERATRSSVLPWGDR